MNLLVLGPKGCWHQHSNTGIKIFSQNCSKKYAILAIPNNTFKFKLTNVQIIKIRKNMDQKRPREYRETKCLSPVKLYN